MEVPRFNKQSMPRRKRLDELESQIIELAAHIQAATDRLRVLSRKYDDARGQGDRGHL